MSSNITVAHANAPQQQENERKAAVRAYHLFCAVVFLVVATWQIKKTKRN